MAEKPGLGDGCCVAGNHSLKVILDGGVPLNLCALILAPSEWLLSPCKIRVQRTAGTNVALQRPRTATFNNESAPPATMHAPPCMHENSALRLPPPHHAVQFKPVQSSVALV